MITKIGMQLNKLLCVGRCVPACASAIAGLSYDENVKGKIIAGKLSKYYLNIFPTFSVCFILKYIPKALFGWFLLSYQKTTSVEEFQGNLIQGAKSFFEQVHIENLSFYMLSNKISFKSMGVFDQ